MNPKLALALVLVLALVFGTAPGRALLGIRDGYEAAAYTVLREEGRFSLRRYESALIARTRVERRPEAKRPENEGFRRLAGYIFGGNVEEQQIAMTVPVFTDRDEAMTMTFVLPSKWSLDALPKPKDGRVELTEEPPKTYAVVRFTGVAYPDDLERYRPDLQRWMEAQGVEATGPARMAFYDPPWTIPFFRRNEVLIPVGDEGA